MRHAPIDPALFVSNRQRVSEQLLPHSVAVVNANDVLPTNADGSLAMHPNADLFYLSGIEQEESILVLSPNAPDEKLREVLFLREPSEHLKIWEGHKHSKAEASSISGIKTVKWLSEFRGVFHTLMCDAQHVYLNSNEHKRAVVEVETRDARFVQDCRQRYPLHQYHRLARLMHDLRAIKSQPEIDLIKHACQITKQGFLRVLAFTKPGVNEAEVEAEFGVPIPGVILPEAQWAKTAIKKLPPPGPLDWTAIFGRSAPVMLDLGCGTGLVGKSLKGYAQRVDGVDLAAGMVSHAQASGYYHQVWQADLHEALSQAQATGTCYDLIVSADVFIYVGALERMFQLVQQVLSIGGGLVFSLEEWTLGSEKYVLRPSLRYAHSMAYVQQLASAHDFQILSADSGLLRHDHGQAVNGLFCVLQKSPRRVDR